jgi:hypothetical protein
MKCLHAARHLAEKVGGDQPGIVLVDPDHIEL